MGDRCSDRILLPFQGLEFFDCAFSNPACRVTLSVPCFSYLLHPVEQTFPGNCIPIDDLY